MLDLRGIHHVAIIVSDYEASRDFYVNKLGFPVLRENYRPERGDWKLDLKCGDAELELFGIPGRPQRLTNPEANGLRHLAFRVEDLEGTIARLAEMGIVCEPIRWDPYTQNRATFFRDPDGLPLELHE